MRSKDRIAGENSWAERRFGDRVLTVRAQVIHSGDKVWSVVMKVGD